MLKYFFLVFGISFPFLVFSQNNLGKDVFDNLASKENLEKLKSSLLEKMSSSRSEYDDASFNYAVSLSDNAGLYENEDRFKRNQKIIFEAVKLASGLKNSAKEDASNMNEAGEMLYASNKYKLAEEAFRSSIKLFEANNLTKDPVYALVLGNLGLLYHTTGRYTLAQKFTDSCLNLRHKILPFESSPIAASINNQAVLLKDMGNYNEAMEKIEEALRINEKALSKKSIPYALSLNNQAMIMLAMGRNDDAEVKLQESLSIASETLKEKSTNYSRLMINLAVLYQLNNRLQDAEVIYQKVIKQKEKKFGTNHPDYAHCLNLLASLYMDMGKEKFSEAEALLKKSVAIFKKIFGDTHPSYASAISNLGNYYRISGKLSDAEPLLRSALEIRKTELGEDHPDYIVSLESIGLLLWQQGKNIDAAKNLKESAEKTIKEIDLYFTPLSEIEKTKFWDKIKPRIHRFNSFAIHVRKSQPSLAFDMYNYQLITKALILNSTNNVKNQILQSKDIELIKRYYEWLDAKENLARLYTLSKQQLKEESINIDSLENIANARERELSVKSAFFAKGYGKSKITYKNIVEKLNPEEAAIEIFQLQRFHHILTDSVQYVALILSKDKSAGGLEVVLMQNGGEMEKKYYNYYKNAIKQKLVDEHSYKHYWERIEKHLANKKTIYLSLDGIFNQINLSALLTPSGAYLIDQKNLVILTNTKEIIDLKQASVLENKNPAILVGYPLYGSRGTVERLPGTKLEIETIKKVLATKYQTNSWLQEEATEDNVKNVKNPSILHIATHGFFIPEVTESKAEKAFGIALDKSIKNPLLRSGLLFVDAEKVMAGKSENGILTAYEISNMDLTSTSIVVLSACETGLGDVKNGEGVYGMQRAFRIAGAETIIMSLWKVNDASTQELMSKFYKNYISSGNKQKAFKEAQISLREKYKEPYYWGAFVMVE
ncbi:MAG: CHAT domain-containing protein [Cytophagales bacterium]|nr:MAG: CHAT domain-containing protein [Cytophagales bacterium]